MDDLEEVQQPDEFRPAKRMRLEAPMDLTEELQEEMVDDGNWDDVYEDTAKETAQVPAAPAVVAEPGIEENGSLGNTNSQITATAAAPSSEEAQQNSPVPPQAIEDTSEQLVPEEVPPPSIDEPSARMVNEISTAETHINHQPQDATSDVTEGDKDPPDGVAERATGEEGAAPPTIATISDSMDTQPPPAPKNDPEFLAAAAAQKGNDEAEWQFNSSDAESSDADTDSDIGSDDSSDYDSDSDDGYELLDPASAARILMSGDGEDAEGRRRSNGGGDRQPRTTNEVKEEVIPKPDVQITEDMKITHLGNVERIVENLVMVKGVTPGEYQVLEIGSVLCNEKREVIGAVADTFGRVQEPLYSVAFTNAQEVADAGMEHGMKVFYVDEHSTFVFTQPLKNMKGTDASNIHDEEVGEDELEFSDDEVEQEYKRQRKAAKRGGRSDFTRSAFNEDRAARTYGAPGHDSGYTYVSNNDAPQQPYAGGLNYDEGGADEFYSPLKRPDNLSQMMAAGGLPPRPQHNAEFERGRGRGRGFDRGRGRGDRGRGRGGFDRRGGRGGHGQDRGGFGQDRGGRGGQNGYRGNAHSFPDRHNHDRPSHPLPQPPPTYQQRRSSFHHSPPRPPAPQTYQFNGYNFQYGNTAPQAAQYGGNYGQHSQPQSPAANAAYTNGTTSYYGQYSQAQTPAALTAYPNSSYHANGSYQQPAQNYYVQQQQYQQPAYGAWQGQQYAQPGAAPTPQQQTDLANILRQFNGGQQQAGPQQGGQQQR